MTVSVKTPPETAPRPDVIRLEITLDDEHMRTSYDFSYLLTRIASAFNQKEWPTFEDLYDARGKRVGTIRYQYEQ